MKNKKKKRIGRKRTVEQIRRKKEWESYNCEEKVYIDKDIIKKMGIKYVDALIERL